MHARPILSLLLAVLFVLPAAAELPARFAAVPVIAEPTCPETDMSRRLYRTALGQGRYIRSQLQPWDEHPEMMALAWNSNEHGVRPNAHTIAGLATLIRFGPFDAEIIGATRGTLEREAVGILRRVTSTHKTGPYTCADGKQWGDQWQSALWAAEAALGAWTLWDRIDPDLQEAVGRMVEHEADRFVGVVPPARVYADTKAEENAWNAQVISLAACMFPNHPHHGAWLETQRVWDFASFPRKEDLNPRTLAKYHIPAASVAGPTIHSDFTLENHRRVHPDYMSAGHMVAMQLYYHTWSGVPLPDTFLFNHAEMIGVRKYFMLDDGNSYYPNGQDWVLFREPDWVYSYGIYKYLLDDPECALLERACLETAERMQARNEDGCLYRPDEWFFPSSQHSIFQRLGLTYLLHRMFGPGPEPATWEEFDAHHNGLRHFEAGKMLCLRTPKMMASMSWGAVVMGEVALRGKDFLTSPDVEGLVGYMREKGQSSGAEVIAATVETEGRPCVQLELARAGGKLRQQVACYLIEPDIVVYLEKITATTDVVLERCSTGVLGIVNQEVPIYGTPGRTIYHPGGELRLEPVGERETITTLSSGNWLNVDRRLRVDYAAPGDTRVVDTAGPERGRITERIVINALGGDIGCEAGEVVSRLGMVIRAECDDTSPARIGIAEKDGNLVLRWRDETYTLR